MLPVNQYYENVANNLLEKFKKRRFEAFYCPTKEDALKKVLEIIPIKSVVSYGGSESIKEAGILDSILEGDYTVIDRHAGDTDEEERQSLIKSTFCDYYLMSSNAITKNGELVNIDGFGNRVAALTFGPHNVILVVSMNKLCEDVENAIWRVQNNASPKNANRLNRKTPCAITGSCGDCYGDASLCSSIVITRRSTKPGRIKIILVAEDLGY
ncbi:MAG: lactate utilization protein [Eubacteriaceae bacterium]